MKRNLTGKKAQEKMIMAYPSDKQMPYLQVIGTIDNFLKRNPLQLQTNLNGNEDPAKVKFKVTDTEFECNTTADTATLLIHTNVKYKTNYSTLSKEDSKFFQNSNNPLDKLVTPMLSFMVEYGYKSSKGKITIGMRTIPAQDIHLFPIFEVHSFGKTVKELEKALESIQTELITKVQEKRLLFNNYFHALSQSVSGMGLSKLVGEAVISEIVDSRQTTALRNAYRDKIRHARRMKIDIAIGEAASELLRVLEGESASNRISNVKAASNMIALTAANYGSFDLSYVDAIFSKRYKGVLEDLMAEGRDLRKKDEADAADATAEALAEKALEVSLNPFTV
jgi:hypothetical protein